MKNFLRPLKLACLAAASMLIVSCGGSADYRSILPADSFMTVSVNPASLMQKCEAGDLDQHPLYVRIKAELDKDQNLSAEEKEYLLALLKNPGESGIDVKKDFFFFAAMEGTVDAPVMRGGLLLPIGDKAKFDALLARINEKSGVTPEPRAAFRSSIWVKRAMPAFCAPTTTSRSWSISCRTALTIWPATCASCSPRRAARA